MRDKHLLNNLEFPNDYEIWQKSSANITDNKLEICGHPVMESWEKTYMQKLAEIVSTEGGNILEIGYGMGLSSYYINQYSFDSHIIIEANTDVFNELKKFTLRNKKKIIPIFGFWEDITPFFANESFNGILFDTYPIKKENLFCERFRFLKEAYRLLKKNGIFTQYSGEVSFTEEYKKLIIEAGFSNFTGVICEVNPPESCLYWDDKKILAPIIRK